MYEEDILRIATKIVGTARAYRVKTSDVFADIADNIEVIEDRDIDTQTPLTRWTK